MVPEMRCPHCHRDAAPEPRASRAQPPAAGAGRVRAAARSVFPAGGGCAGTRRLPHADLWQTPSPPALTVRASAGSLVCGVRCPQQGLGDLQDL